MVYRLLKFFYNLTQALKFEYKHILKFFFEKLELDFINIDDKIFVTKTDINSFKISIFVNDIKVMGIKKMI